MQVVNNSLWVIPGGISVPAAPDQYTYIAIIGGICIVGILAAYLISRMLWRSFRRMLALFVCVLILSGTSLGSFIAYIDYEDRVREYDHIREACPDLFDFSSKKLSLARGLACPVLDKTSR